MADDEWRFELEDLEDEHTESEENADSASDVVRGGGFERPIEPGSPRAENVLFVVLGVLAGLLLVYEYASAAGL